MDTWLRVTMGVLVLTTRGFRSVEGAHCEPIRIPTCATMPYTDIQMPNLLYHSTQQNANLVIEQYHELLKTNCSSVLHFFLCSMFAPICPLGFNQEMIPPCRGLCEQAKAGCEPLMLKYNVSWPKELSCDWLPKYERGVCISPEAMLWSPDDNPKSVRKATTKGFAKDCNCVNVTEISARDAYLKNKDFHYGMKAKFLSAEGPKGGPIMLKVNIVSVIKKSTVALTRGEEIILWNADGCICPVMKAGVNYVIMGHEDERNRRIVYNEHSVAGRWKKSWNSQVEKWKKLGKGKESRKRKSRKRRRKKDKKRRRKNKGQRNSKRKSGKQGSKHERRRQSRRKDKIIPTPGVL